MRKRLKIEIGRTYNRLKVIKQVSSKDRQQTFECECLCGNVCQASSSQLIYGKKKSCGCQKIDSAKNLCINRNTTHGLSHTKEYTKIYQSRTRTKHRERINERKRKAQRNLKLKVFKAYSIDGAIRCRRCGETDDRVLNIDHINGGGRIHQRMVSNVYQDLVNRKFPDGFQVLCQNCNIIKMHENKEACKKGYLHKTSKIQLERSSRSRIRYRLKIIGHYSNGENSCCRCKNSDIRVLCLDHIDGSGAEERRQYGNTYNWWKSLIERHFPKGVQVLCQNCNRRKMYENNEF